MTGRLRNRGDGWRLRRWVNTPERDGGPWVWKAVWEWRPYLVTWNTRLSVAREKEDA